MNKENLGPEISNCEAYLKDLDFVDIDIKSSFLPVGSWPEGLSELINCV